MDSITIDGLHEDAFRQSIEDLLRRGLADEAATRLRSLLEPHTGEGELFPARFMSVSPEDIELSGWEALDEGLRKYDRSEQPVTAICLSFGDPDGKGPAPDGAGLLSLTVETSYFSDEAFPFSESDRNDLLDGYSSFGCQWAGDCEGVDHAITFRGVDDLHGSLAGLEQRLLSSHNPDPEEIRAGTIASCYLAVLFHQALRESFAKRRMGRPLCVLTANNGVYPSFDAPVLSCDEYLAGGDVIAVAAAAAPEWVPDEAFAPAHAAEDEEDGAEEASLLNIGIRRTAKQPVLALADGDADMSMDAMANAALGGGGAGLPPYAMPGFSGDLFEEPEPAFHAVEEDVFEDPASFVEVSPEPKPEAEPETSAPAEPFEAEDLGADIWLPTEEPVAEPVIEPAAELDVPDEPAHIPAAFNEAVEEIEAPSYPEALDRDDDLPPYSIIPELGALPERLLGDTEWPAREEVVDHAPVSLDSWEPAEQSEPEPLLAPGQPAPKGGHSLRARLGTPEVEPLQEERPSLWTRLIDWIETKLRRS